MMSMPVGPGWKASNSPAGRFRAHFRLAIQYDPRAVREKFRQVQEYLHSGDCYQVNPPSVFKRPILAMNGRHSFSLSGQPRAV